MEEAVQAAGRKKISNKRACIPGGLADHLIYVQSLHTVHCHAKRNLWGQLADRMLRLLPLWQQPPEELHLHALPVSETTAI